MKIRMQKPTKEESKFTTENIEPTRAAVLKYFQDRMIMHAPVNDSDFKITYYCSTMRGYKDWQNHFVIECNRRIGGGVLGFCDSPIEG